MSVSGPSGDDITPNPTSQSMHNKEQSSPEDLQDPSSLNHKGQNIAANVTKNIKLKIDTQNVQSPKKKGHQNHVKFDSPKSTDVNPRLSDNESNDVNTNNKAKQSKIIVQNNVKNINNQDDTPPNNENKTATDKLSSF